MSFECPEWPLTKEEWSILADAAQNKAGDYRVTSGAFAQQKDMKRASYYAIKADKINDVLAKLENEYYETHPDEDPEKGGENNGTN